MSTPILPDYQAPFKPVPNVTPFTIRDGMTMLKKIDYISKYLTRELLPFINEHLTEFGDKFEVEVNSLIAQVNEALAMQGLGLDAKIAQLEQDVADAVEEIINASIPIAAPIVRATTDYIEVVALAERFTGIDPTGVNDSSAGIAAAVDATPIGGTLRIPPGKYLLTASISVSKSIIIDAYGATFITGAGVSAFRFVGAFEDAYAVTALNIVQVQMETTESTTLIPGVKLTLNYTPDWRRGDTVRVYADNPIADARPGDGVTSARVGQNLTVHSVDTNEVTLLGVLFDAMNDDVRVARYADTFRVNMRGATFDVTDNILSTKTPTNHVRIESIVEPRFKDITVLRATGPALAFYGCHRAQVDTFTQYFGLDSPADNIYGYGIIDVAGTKGYYSNLYGKNLRHLFTTDVARIEAGEANPRMYGRTNGFIVINSVGESGSNNPFDTHHGSIYGTFQNCRAENSSRGFQLRGLFESIIDSKTINCAVPVRIFTESAGGETWGHYIDGFYAENATGPGVFDFQVRTGSHPNAGIRVTEDHTIRNVRVKDYTGAVIYNRNCVVNYSEITAKVAATKQDNSSDFTSVGGLFVQAGDVFLDYRNNTAGNDLAGFGLGNAVATSTYVSGTVLVIGFPNARSTQFITHGNLATMQIDEIVFQGNAPTVHGSINSGFVKWRAGGATSQNFVVMSSGSVATTFASWEFITNTRQDHITIAMQALGGNVTLLGLPTGIKQGQRLTIINASSSGNATLKHDPGTTNLPTTGRLNLKGATDKVLAPGDSIDLVYTNSGNWRQVAAVA